MADCSLPEWKSILRTGVSAALVFERSLAYLRTLMPETPVLVVYIPSPLASYSLISSDVSFEGSEDLKPGFSPKERIPENSDKMCEMIRAATMSQGAGFLDLRPVIRAGTVHDVLHGPRDFKHFNRKGYEILGKAVAERLELAAFSAALHGTQPRLR